MTRYLARIKIRDFEKTLAAHPFNRKAVEKILKDPCGYEVAIKVGTEWKGRPLCLPNRPTQPSYAFKRRVEPRNGRKVEWHILIHPGEDFHVELWRCLLTIHLKNVLNCSFPDHVGDCNVYLNSLAQHYRKHEVMPVSEILTRCQYFPPKDVSPTRQSSLQLTLS